MKIYNYVLCCLLIVSISTILFETNVFATPVSVAISPIDTGKVTTDVGGIDCGYLSAATCSTNLTELTNVIATAVPAPGYVFVEWLYSTLPANPTNPKTFIVPTIPVTVTAKFALQPVLPPVLTITPSPVNGTLTSSPPGINCGVAVGATACSASFASGTFITLTATPTPNNGYYAQSIRIADVSLIPIPAQTVLSRSLTLTLPTTASAIFDADIGFCGTANNTSVLTAPSTNLCIVGIPSTVSGTGPWTWNCNPLNGGTAPATCNANTSAPATYQLTVNKAGTGSGTVTGTNISCGATCSASFTQGTPVTLTALATSGTFTGWSGTGITCPGTGSCTVSMNAAAAVTATFTAAVTTPGVCGGAAGQPTSVAPDTNLCNPGNPTAVSGYGPWSWTCNSTNGGPPSTTCTAPLATQQVYVQLPQTGQNTCYSYIKTNNSYVTNCTGTGQDGEFQKGAVWPATRFTENKLPDNVTSDGTVTDNLTGLVWLQKADCFQPQSWANALTAAKNTANGACGLLDNSTPGTWRLPNINELNSLTDLQQSAPTFPVNAPGVPMGSPFTGLLYNYQYWSSTSTADGGSAWTVSFQSGGLLTNGKTQTGSRVWLVKGDSIRLLKTGQTLCYDPITNSPTTCAGTGQDGDSLTGVAWDNSRFIDIPSEGTITDSVTGLVWLKNANCGETLNGVAKSGPGLSGMLWFDESLAWVKGLSSTPTSHCGLNDGSTVGQWRIPNRNELLSLVNYAEARNNATSNATWLTGLGFTGVQTGNFYRTSDTSLLSPTQTWRVDLRDGTSFYRDKELSDWVLPVRDGNFLSVNIVGTGSGSVNSSTPGLLPAITCPSGTCRSYYAPNTTIDLTPASTWYSQFFGWIGCDSVSGPKNDICRVTTNQSRVATAVFDEFLSVGLYDIDNPTNALTSGYASRIQPSYDYLASKSVQNGSILTLPLPLSLDGTVQVGYFENLFFSSPLNVTLTGGWNGTWPNPSFTGFTTVHGSLRISNGKLIINSIKIN